MHSDPLKTILRFLIAVASLSIWSQSISGQGTCLSEDEAKRMLAQVNSPQTVSLNAKLRDQLLKLKEDDQKSVEESIDENKKPDAVMKRFRKSREKNTSRLCPILKRVGWPTTDVGGEDGVPVALFLLLKNYIFLLESKHQPGITSTGVK